MIRKRHARLAAVSLVSFGCLVSKIAHAQEVRGFALNAFDPAERGSDWFASESLDLRGNLRPSAGVVFDWAHDPLVLRNPDGSMKTEIVADQVILHPGATLNLFDRLRFGFDLPIAVYEKGSGVTLGSTSYPTTSSAAVGDLRLGGDLRLIGKYGDPFTGALGVQVFLPVGSQRSFMSDGQVRIQGRALIAGDVSLFTYAAKLGIEGRPQQESFDGSNLGSTLVFSAAAGLRLFDHRLTIGPEAFGSTVITSGQGPFQSQNTPVEGLIGAHYAAGDFLFGVGGGSGITHGFGSPSSRLVATVEWAPAVNEDRDADGITDKEDACPDAAGPRSADPAMNGCPDKDHDGIADDKDACPDVAGVASSDPRKNGCPPDADGDGILDAVDACPNEPGLASKDPKANGCPDKDGDSVPDVVDACPDVPGVATDDPKTNGCPADRDHDTIPDAKDACPDEPGVLSDDPKKNGCPPDPDRDHDGIPNDKDACPDVYGKPDPDPKKNGCPLAFVEGKLIRITDQVKFRTGSAALDPAGDAVLVAVEHLLEEHAEIGHLKIEGHTDNVGGAAHNQKLSEARAASVMAWLVKHGIARTRLTSAGYGMTKPIMSNEDAEGRRLNRRVEFHIEDKGDASQGK
jgi:outer membrane protein OmpA-like peptidoglycan-associated protein